MFYHDPPDSAEAEFRRRLIDQGPGSLTTPVQTLEQIRAEFAEQQDRRNRAVELTKAGLWHLARKLLAGGDAPVGNSEQERLEHPEVSTGALAGRVEPERLQAYAGEAPSVFQGPNGRADRTDFDKKDTVSKSAPDFRGEAGSCGHSVALEPISPSLLGTGALATSSPTGGKRRHPDSVPWHEKRFIQGHRVSKTISEKRRGETDDAFLRWRVLGIREIVCITLKPSHLDDCDPVQRMQYWKPFVGKFRSFRAGRCRALKKSVSWWPVRCITVREAHAFTHMGEHLHMLVHVPTRAEADHLIEVVQGTASCEGWGENTQAQRVDARECMAGGKRGSFLNYIMKAVSPQSRGADPTIGWQESGALVGDRVFITRNLTDSKVVAETEVGVATFKRVREDRKREAFIRRALARREGLNS